VLAIDCVQNKIMLAALVRCRLH